LLGVVCAGWQQGTFAGEGSEVTLAEHARALQEGRLLPDAFAVPGWRGRAGFRRRGAHRLQAAGFGSAASMAEDADREGRWDGSHGGLQAPGWPLLGLFEA
jgi:hypothetical protein